MGHPTCGYAWVFVTQVLGAPSASTAIENAILAAMPENDSLRPPPGSQLTLDKGKGKGKGKNKGKNEGKGKKNGDGKSKGKSSFYDKPRSRDERPSIAQADEREQ